MQLTPDIGVELSSADMRDLCAPFVFASGASFSKPLVAILPEKNIYLTRKGQFIFLGKNSEHSEIEIVEFACSHREILAGLLTILEARGAKRKLRLANLRSAAITVRRALLALT